MKKNSKNPGATSPADRRNLPGNLPKTLTRSLAVAFVLLTAALPTRAGVALKLYYDPIPGNTVSNLTSNPIFPSAPTSYEVLANGLQESINIGDTFGAWTRGFIEAPQTGLYTFSVASDDEGQLWLSTNSSPAGLVQICENQTAVGYATYSQNPGQKSASIPLVAGQKYYFEMFHQEGIGGDHCEASWTLPDGTFETIISGNHLWPFPVDLADPTYPSLAKAPAVLTAYNGVGVTSLPGSISVEEGRPVDLTVTVEASQPAFVQWYSNGVAIANANLLNYHIPVVPLAANGAVYSVIITNSLGQDTASTTVFVSQDTVAPNLVDALNLGNPTGDVAVIFDEAVDPVSGTTLANYSISGATITSAHIGTTPNMILLRVSGTSIGATLTVNNVHDLAASPNTVAANSSVVIDQNLHTWLRLDEATGTSVADSSGNNRNATFVNGAVPGYTGKVLRAAKFDGLAGYVGLQTGYNDFSQGMTVAVWANPTSTLTAWARFIDFGNGPDNNNIIFARNGNSSDLTFEVRVGVASGGQVTAGGAIALNQWQHFVATLDNAGNVTLYKNGVVVATGVTGVPNVVNRTNCFVGRSDFPQDGYFQGKMDDVRIYNRVLGPEAIAALASGGGADDSSPSIPPVSIVATTPSTAEKATPPGVFTVTRTGSTSSSLSVSYVIGGTATNGVNYTALTNPVVIAAGTTSAVVQIKPIDFSFQQLSETVNLTLAGNTNYTIADADNDTVTILNNDVSPGASIALADNAPSAAALTTVDVWFNASVTTPTATNLANYTLNNAPGLSITNATLGNRNLRVVLGISGGLVPTNATLSVSGVQDPGGNSSTTNVPIRVRLPAANLLANIYHASATRSVDFAGVNNGLVNTTANGGGANGFDTFGGAANAVLTQFGGMLYPSSVDIREIKVDLGQQFSDGGNWKVQPSVYILKNPVDSNSTRPEADTNDWVLVPANLISGSQFPATGVDANPSPNTPIVFDLSGLTAGQRTGYGWAVGGAKGDGANGFLSFTEMRAYGFPGSNSVMFVQQPTNVTVIAGQRAIFSGVLNTNLLAINYQWLRDGVAIDGATNGTYTTIQTTTGDNGAHFSLIASNALLSITSQVAVLSVTPRTTPPVVVAATMDQLGNIDVWFDEPVDAGSAQNSANYVLNDPALSIIGISQDSYQLRVGLTVSGTPSVSSLTLTVSSVMDIFGNTLGTQTVPLFSESWPALNLVANQFHQGRAVMLSALTNGVAQYASAANTDNADTFGGNLGLSDFVGLIYSQPQVFGVVKVDLGHQFADGGDWSALPTLYVLKSPQDPGQTPPETSANWVAVPAKLVSGNIFSWEIDAPNGSAPVNSPIAFDLSHLPASQRTGYGWAVGGVPGNALASAKTGIAPAAEFLSISELSSFGVPANAYTNVAGAPQILLDVAPLSQTYPSGLPLTYSVYATGTQPISYQWKFNGTNLTDNGHISGAHSNLLTIGQVFANDAGTYQLFMTNSAGNNASAVATLAVSRIALNNGSGWTQNGGAVISNNVLSLIDGQGNEARSSFVNYPQYIGAFRASFTYQDLGGGGADGATFVMQNSPAGASALGGGGGGLGYAGIIPSAALEFNIYGPNTPGIALRSNGATGTPYAPTTPVNIASGDAIGVNLNYDGTTLSLTLTDAVAGVSFSTNYIANLPSIVGTNTAYVGITAASGGVASTQNVSNFLFVSLPGLSVQTTGTNTYVFTWPASAGGFVLQQNTTIGTGSWVNVTSPVTQINGQNQVVVPIAGGNRFYRLSLP
ncbi:LamG-like jellyroll fold domain-containing protein [Pedosphaera parvula]|uniref:Legume lectin beta domain protein n=1 Tax=Pedosphaera parvula (strain Ellin514) TaxID=320771 RepID=B9XCZ6_PEDPL|nr:LamG-like jellyroll fold domain-containing protein [Pedosphaera parvula]EEF62342.1 legume lectin beta domain protein [Pedosphaera parvula Ellin514]